MGISVFCVDAQSKTSCVYDEERAGFVLGDVASEYTFPELTDPFLKSLFFTKFFFIIYKIAKYFYFFLLKFLYLSAQTTIFSSIANI